MTETAKNPAELTESASPPANPPNRYDPRPGINPAVMSFANVARDFDVSVTTLRRRRDAGELDGAHKIPSPTGETWVVPLETILELGYQPREKESEPADDQAGSDAMAFAREMAEFLSGLVENSQRQLEAAESDRKNHFERAVKAEAALETAKAETERLRQEAERLQAELEEAKKTPKKKGFWGSRGA